MYYYNPYFDPYDESYRYERRKPESNVNETFFAPEEAFMRGNLIRSQYDPYRNYRPYMPNGKNDRENLLLSLMIYGANLHDLVLRLDIIPNDQTAMRLFKEYTKKYDELEKEYVRRYGPLCAAQAENRNGIFTWLETPSPWLGE